MVHGIFGKIVLGVVILLFVLLGTEALLSLATKQPPSVEVNGDQLPRQQLKEMVEAEKRRLLQQNSGYLKPDMIDNTLLRSRVAENWINQQLLSQTLEEWGVDASLPTIHNLIKQNPQFQQDGQFKAQLLEQWLTTRQMSALELYQQLNTNLGLDALATELQANIFITPKEEQLQLSLKNQTRDFRLMRINSNDLKDQITIDDASLNTFFKQNIENYMQPEAVKVSYVVVEKKTFQVANKDITEASLKGRYETYKQSLNQEQERKASHILIAFDERSESAAQKLADEIYQQIESGDAQFEDLAQDQSDDGPSAEDGGSLPLASRGTYVPEFEAALYKLKLNEVSKPVKTEFGYHIIRLDELKAQKVDSYEERLASLKATAKKELQAQQYQEALQELSQMAFESANLEAIATAYNLSVEQTELFSKNEVPKPLAAQEIQSVIFKRDFIDEGRNSDLIELKDRALVVHPLQYRAQAEYKLADIKDRVTQDFMQQEALKLAEKQGRQLLAQFKQSPEKADEGEQQWEEFKAIDRRSSAVNSAIIQKLFATSKPQENQPVFNGLTQGDEFVILELTKVGSKAKLKNSADDDSKKANTKEQIISQQTNELLEAFVQKLRQSAEIDYSPQFIKGDEA